MTGIEEDASSVEEVGSIDFRWVVAGGAIWCFLLAAGCGSGTGDVSNGGDDACSSGSASAQCPGADGTAGGDDTESGGDATESGDDTGAGAEGDAGTSGDDTGTEDDSGGPGDAANCESGRRLCDGACVDVSADDDHCGECGRSCGSGKVCANEKCRAECPQPDSGARICAADEWNYLSHPDAPDVQGYDIEITFDEEVDAVEDLGWDESGEEAIDLEDHVEDGRLITMPPGRYKFDQSGGSVDLSGMTFGLRGEPSAAKEDVEITPGDNQSFTVFDGGEVENMYLGNFTVDHNDSSDESLSLIGESFKNVGLFEDLREDGRQIPGNQFLYPTIADEEDSVVVLRRIEGNVPRIKGDYPGDTWVYMGVTRSNKGRVYFDDLEISNVSESGIYTGKHGGEVHMNDITTKNCAHSGIRIAGGDSTLANSKVIVDAGDWPEGNVNVEEGRDRDDAFKINRGVWLQSAELPQGGSYIENVEMEMLEKPPNNYVGLFVNGSRTGGATIRGMDLYVEAGQGPKYGAVFNVSGYSLDSSVDPSLDVEGLTIQAPDLSGSRSQAVDIGENRDGTVFEDACLEIGNGGGFGAEGTSMTVKNSTVDVDDEAFATSEGGSIDTSGISTDGSCKVDSPN